MNDVDVDVDEDEVSASEQILDEVDRALERLDDGSYGRCEVCGEDIGDDRLAADPTTRTCGRHTAS